MADNAAQKPVNALTGALANLARAQAAARETAAAIAAEKATAQGG